MNRLATASFVIKGLWVWPPDPRGQRKVLRKVAASPHLMAAIIALGKSKEGMSDAEIDDAINDSSEWTTIWVIRQLTSLGFVEFKVDFFGNPARYLLTELGRTALVAMTGQPLPQRPPAPSPQTPRPAPTAPKAA
jgi:hypothetical protein